MSADPRRVKDLFAAAIEIADPRARRALLDEQCRDDPELRERLDALLLAHDHPKSALERPLALANTGPYEGTAGHTSGSVGTVVAGRYKLLESIGEGGMGEVWVADQLEPIKRRVALKMIKPGMDSRSILGRFEAERQALALMDHPNIARVLDAGTTSDGRPFFVMELVKGTPITQFCDARKLSPRERLELFIPVCQAIQHAHQKGIIHRDIKPTNVLVALHDERPVPKVIDFGVAKAVGQQLTEKTLYTGFGALVGTPVYMAPEQATFNQLDVDTRADVYALGVLLYELLAGSPPFEPERLKQAALDEVLRLVREEEPQRPSHRLSTSQSKATIAATRQTDPTRLSKLMRGELDWIVMKALEKDRNRRYDTATGLAKDVQRYLDGEMVEARSPTLGYRLRKFAMKKSTAIGVVFFMAMMPSLGWVWFAMLRAKDAEQAARAARADAHAQLTRAVEERVAANVQRNRAETSERQAKWERDQAQLAGKRLLAAQEEQQANQYVWDMQLLPLAFDAGHVAEVNRLLGRHVPQSGQPDRRGFEWFHWHRQLNSDRRTDQLPGVGTRGGVWGVSPDGSRVARFTIPTAEFIKEDSPALTVWDVATRKVLLAHRMPIKPPGNQTFISTNPKSPLFSKDGERVAVEWGFTTPGEGTRFGFQHRRQVLAVASGKVLLDLETEPARPAPGSPRIAGAFGADGRRFAAVCRAPGREATEPGHVRVWDLETGKEISRPLDGEVLADNAFNPDGTRLVTWKHVRRPWRASVWDLATGQESVGWEVPERLLAALAVSPDGRLVAGVTADDSEAPKGANPLAEPQVVKVWDAVTGKERHTLPLSRLGGPAPRSARAFFSPDGSRLAVVRTSASSFRQSSVSDCTVWDAATGKQLPPLGSTDINAARGVRGAAFSPDGKQLLGADGNVLRTWDVETGQPVLTLRGHLSPIGPRSFTPDGKRLWSLDDNGTLKEWDARPPEPLAITFVTGRIALPSSTWFALSADGGRVAALVDVKQAGQAAFGLGVRVWDTAGKIVSVLVPPPRGPEPKDRTRSGYYGLALSRDGRRVLLARTDVGPWPGKDEAAGPPSDLTVWDVDTKAVLLHQQLESRSLLVATISPDGRTVAAATRPPGAPFATRVFDVDTRREGVRLTDAGLGSAAAISFSPDGRRLVALRHGGFMVNQSPGVKLVVWDVERGSQLSVVELGTDLPFTLGTASGRIAWSPDGTRFALSHGRGDSSAITIYNAVTGKAVLTLDQPVTSGIPASVPWSIAYSPDGRRIAGLLSARVVGGTPVLKMWDAAGGKELLAIRLPPNTNAQRGKYLTFTGDGHRLLLAEYENDPPPPATGKATSPAYSVLLTTWDATPQAGREPRTP